MLGCALCTLCGGHSPVAKEQYQTVLLFLGVFSGGAVKDYRRLVNVTCGGLHKPNESPPSPLEGAFVVQKQNYAVLPAEWLRAKGAGRDKSLVGGKLMSSPFAIGTKTENCVCGWAAVTGLYF